MTNRTSLPSWQALQKHALLNKDKKINALFNEDANRFNEFSIELPMMLLDFSKNLISKDTFEKLIDLANECDIATWRNKLFTGAAINQTENRPVLHTALRDLNSRFSNEHDKNVANEIRDSLVKMETFTNQVRNATWKGHTGKAIIDVVNIGVGGSNLGPQMATQALKNYSDDQIKVHYVSNVDASQITDILAPLHPETTLFIISSKTFTTNETMTNANIALAWLRQENIKDCQIKQHVVAVTANKSNACKFGIAEENIFDMWDGVGGRFSLWSAIGLPIALYLGFDRFKELLEGAFELDEHFYHAPIEKNAPIILALISVWNCTFLGAKSQAILPYDQPLHMLSAYLQQAEMESNGKSVNWYGERINYPTVPSIWGTLGINGQHAFYQYLHQSNNVVPADFIGSVNSHGCHDKSHDILLSNLFAQTRALMVGRSEEEVRQEMSECGHEQSYINYVAAHKVHQGNRPTNTILLNVISPRTIGSLIALYEHKIFVQGIILQIFSFDQWGVEMGKGLAASIEKSLSKDLTESNFDSSTKALMNYYQSRKAQ